MKGKDPIQAYVVVAALSLVVVDVDVVLVTALDPEAILSLP